MEVRQDIEFFRPIHIQNFSYRYLKPYRCLLNVWHRQFHPSAWKALCLLNCDNTTAVRIETFVETPRYPGAF